MNRRESTASGGILLTVLATMAVLTALVAGAIMLTGQFSRNAARSRAISQAIAVADGALQMLYADWQAQSREFALTHPNMPLPSFTPSSSCVPGSSEFPGLQGYCANANRLMIDPASYRLCPITLNGPSTKAAGASPSIASYYFKASVDVTAPAGSSPVNTHVRRTFEQHMESAWRYFAFYEFDLEVQPDGAPLAIHGDIHTNGTFYSGTDWLSLTGLATSTKGFMNDWAPGDTTNSGRTTTLPAFNGGSPAIATRKDLLGLDPRSFDTTDANLNNDNYRELIEKPLTAGAGAGPDPFAGNRLYEQAGAKILVDATGTVTIMDQAGVVHASPTDPFFATLDSAITTGENIQDAHEGASVRLTTIDISKITIAVDTGTLAFNGIIYISDTSASASFKGAIRLRRGARLPAGGLTIASNNPVYIWGDYNTGGTYANPTDTAPSTQPDSNTNGNPPDAPSAVPGYVPPPAAIFADATTILSNAWVDAGSTNPLLVRLPANTTVNSGLVTGSVATDPGGGYGQGVEGTVRFLENWKPSDLGGGGAQQRFTYHGALMSWWHPQQATASCSYGTYFTQPANYWFYDTSFLSNPPKPALGLISFSKGRWYLE